MKVFCKFEDIEGRTTYVDPYALSAVQEMRKDGEGSPATMLRFSPQEYILVRMGIKEVMDKLAKPDMGFLEPYLSEFRPEGMQEGDMPMAQVKIDIQPKTGEQP